MRSRGLLEAASRAGLVALVVQSNRPRGLLHSHAMVFGRTPAPLPVAIAAREPAARLARLASASPVRLRLNLVNRIQRDVEAHNVVAEIRGRDRPEEIVLLGAHLDSWSLGTGAEDNGVNVALVLDVARAFRELGLRPGRTIRFALFTGEEEGLWGSSGYVERHRDELDRHVAAVIFDVGSGRTSGFFLNGRPELAPIVRAALHGLDADRHVVAPIDATDNFAFLLSGVPNLVAAQDTTGYLADYHAASDTLERVDAREARRNAELAAVLVWGLASTIERFPPRQRRAEVERLLVDAGLVEQMKAFDQWEDWKAGRVGFPAPDEPRTPGSP
jgi:Zn-dependent M28 family amino/carboxypeptidase